MSATFKCASCGEVFDKLSDGSWTDEDALKEKGELFPDLDMSDAAVVCDTCFKRMGLGDDEVKP